MHEEVGDPEGVEQVPRALFLLAVVLAQLEDALDLGVPRLDLDRDGALALAAALVDVPRGLVEDPEHRDHAARAAVDAPHLGVVRAHVVDAEPDAARELGDLGAVGQRVVDALDRVLLDGHQEAGTHLVEDASAVHESRGGVDELLLTHQVLGFLDARHVRHVDGDCNAHEQHLRRLFQLGV